MFEIFAKSWHTSTVQTLNKLSCELTASTLYLNLTFISFERNGYIYEGCGYRCIYPTFPLLHE